MRAYASQRRPAAREGGFTSTDDVGSYVITSPKLLVIRFNCDSFEDDKGNRHGSLFSHTTATMKNDEDVLKIKTTRAFNASARSLVDRIVEIVEKEKDDAWFRSLPELSVEYRRYDGCGADGGDPNGSVAAAHAARRETDELTPAQAEAKAKAKAAHKAMGKAKKRAREEGSS